jgi:single-strand DNA-binding protein
MSNASLRMPSLNKVLIAGNLVDDPRTGLLESGVSVANFRIASTQSYKSRDGEWKEKTCFVDVVAWRRTAELVSEYLRKGSPVMVEGELQTNSWQGQDGTQRSRVEILARRVQFLQRQGQGGPSQDQKAGDRERDEPPPKYDDTADSQRPSGDDYDDIPF